MKVEKVNFYFDGGTMEIWTDKGKYCLDRRLVTTTENELYLGYPEDNNKNIIKNAGTIKKELVSALRKFIKNSKDKIYDEAIELAILDIKKGA